ncbi:hypothetical protein MCHI_002225 [Candidatus Magnetoovum chiemensis]|nr:hypothetical protein MCHI_002225 [Candidatus Magnetoovum chiemensis]
METKTIYLPNRLKGKHIFMSASIPSKDRAEKYLRIENADIEIYEAVTSLARAVFAEGGTLVFGGHPTISPMVSLIAGEYVSPKFAEGDVFDHSEEEKQYRKPVVIYQSMAYEKFITEETLNMEKLGYAKIVWTESVKDERFNPGIKDQPQCEKSLYEMRKELLLNTNPIAMICIGGMEGCEEETRMFRELRKSMPIYPIYTTGGAASLIAHWTNIVNIRLIKLDKKHYEVTPYPLIMQIIIEELIHHNEL